MIRINKLTKSFGDFRALDEVNITVNSGAVYGLVGPNGAGKTTLIKHLMGVYRPDSGTVKVDGEKVYENPQVKSKMIYIPDDLYFHSQFNIADAARFYANTYPCWDQKRYEKLKDYFPLQEKNRINRLSRGMQKQVAFWLGICTMPRIMVLDEPMDGLDLVMRKKVWNLLLQDVAERGTTILVSSHNLRELEDICSHIGIIHDGQVLVERELDNLKSDILKIQVVFEGSFPENLLTDYQILHHSENGSIHTLIIRDPGEEAISKLKDAVPLFLDKLPLTLEEIFIYELEGRGYEVDQLLI